MFNDADIETIELEQSANHHAALFRKGICTHGWTQSGVSRDGKPMSGKCAKCLNCGRVFADDGYLDNSRRAADIDGEIEEAGMVNRLPVVD